MKQLHRYEQTVEGLQHATKFLQRTIGCGQFGTDENLKNNEMQVFQVILDDDNDINEQ